MFGVKLDIGHQRYDQLTAVKTWYQPIIVIQLYNALKELIHLNRISACCACNGVIGTVSVLMIAKSECQIILYFLE